MPMTIIVMPASKPIKVPRSVVLLLLFIFY
jgi:hypothetical protein